MKPALLVFLPLALVLGTGILLFLGGDKGSEPASPVPGIEGKPEGDLQAPVALPRPAPDRKEVRRSEGDLDPQVLQKIFEDTKALYVKMRNEPMSMPAEWAWDLLDKQLEKTDRIKFFGPFSRDDFPEITTPQEAVTLANALGQSNAWVGDYVAAAGNPMRKSYETLVMESAPKLIVETTPLFHWLRLGNFSKPFPPAIVPEVRNLWRNALVRQERIRAEKEYWSNAYSQVIVKCLGKKYFPKSEKEENVFPPLATINKQLQTNREAYLKDLERIFREHGVSKGD